jgi:hypothetical protein
MKQIATAAFLLLALFSAPAGAQAPAGTAEDQQVVALLKQVQEQQSLIATNQANIDSKLAVLAEALRLARIYSSRSGGSAK